MNIEQSFEVGVEPDVVWHLFQDIPSVVRCMPGAELTEDRGGGAYAGRVSVQLGPMSASFEGLARITPDVATRTARIDGEGTDRNAGNRGQVSVSYRVTEAEAGSRVSVDAEIKLSGAIARFGRTGLITEMSKRLIEDFVDCLERTLATGTKEEAAPITAGEVPGIRLFFSSLFGWISLAVSRLFRRES